MKNLIVSAMLAATISSTGCNDNSSTDTVQENDQTIDSTDTVKHSNIQNIESVHSVTDADFAAKAADGGIMEVTLGKLAQKNAASKAVKDFGQMMVDDHSQVGEELKMLAARKSITIPSTLGNDHQKKVDELSKQTGKEFDKNYMSLMVEDHEKDIKEFKKVAENGSDTALKSWALSKIPVLEHHLAAAKKTKDQVNGKQ